MGSSKNPDFDPYANLGIRVVGGDRTTRHHYTRHHYIEVSSWGISARSPLHRSL